MRILAQAVSIVFHPLLLATYILWMLMVINPYAFGVTHWRQQNAMVMIMSVFFSTFLLPGFGVALMKPLGFIKSLEIEDKKDRIIPYILTGIFYLWVYKNFIEGRMESPIYTQCFLGITIGLFFAFFVNIFYKISAHAIGMGGLVGVIWFMIWQWQGRWIDVHLLGGTLLLSMNTLLVGAIVLAGLVGAARLYLRAHDTEQVILGYVLGFVAQLLAYSIYT